jgi:hypothetical protein
VVVERFRRARLPDRFERTVKASELLEEADAGALVRGRLDVLDELLELCPTAGNPHGVAAGDRNWPSDAHVRLLEPLPQPPQSHDALSSNPGPVNPEDDGRIGVDPDVEVEITADVCPPGPARNAFDQR